MVGHENIAGAEKAFARGGVQEEFAEVKMKTVVQPARRAVVESGRPMNHSEPAIEFRSKPREMMPFRLRRQRGGFHSRNVAAFGRKPQIEIQENLIPIVR